MKMGRALVSVAASLGVMCLFPAIASAQSDDPPNDDDYFSRCIIASKMQTGWPQNVFIQRCVQAYLNGPTPMPHDNNSIYSWVINYCGSNPNMCSGNIDYY